MAFRIALLFIAIGVLRIVSTYTALNHTVDEPGFISAGLEWLTRHTYTFMPEQPPLSHIPSAIGAWLAGAHDTKIVPNILYDSPSYYRTLSFARAGELPFFILASLMVWFWARRLHGDYAATAAVLVFTNLPPVLAHAGLATTDIAFCGTLMAALYAFESGRVVLLGIAVAAGILTKFSFLLYFPVCVAVMFLLGDRKEYLSRFRPRSLAIAIVTCVLIVWAAYFFSFAPLMEGLHVLAQTQPLRPSQLLVR